MPTLHLPYGGSTADRTLNCPGWLKASEGVARRPTGQAAIDGSMHHEVQEMCQKEGNEPKDHLGFKYEEDGIIRVFTEDDLDLAELAYNATNKVLDDLDIDELEIEPFLQYVEDVVGGSTDLLGLSSDGKTLLSLDYKFGRNKVTAANNAQLLFYPMCARKDKKTADMFKHVERLVLVIVQPQVKGVVDMWECTIKELDAFEDLFDEAFEQAQLPEPPKTPGLHCNWCPAAPYCEQKRASVMSAALLTVEQRNDLQAAADAVTAVEDWLKSVKEEMYLQLNRGVSLDGWKIIDKRATRKWVDESAVYPALKTTLAREDCFTESLVTPAQLEKVLKKKKVAFDLDEFIISESSGTTLAPADHASPAVVVSDVQGHLKDIMK